VLESSDPVASDRGPAADCGSTAQAKWLASGGYSVTLWREDNGVRVYPVDWRIRKCSVRPAAHSSVPNGVLARAQADRAARPARSDTRVLREDAPPPPPPGSNRTCRAAASCRGEGCPPVYDGVDMQCVPLFCPAQVRESHPTQYHSRCAWHRGCRLLRVGLCAGATDGGGDAAGRQELLPRLHGSARQPARTGLQAYHDFP
jgi:hypothetical protein